MIRAGDSRSLAVRGRATNILSEGPLGSMRLSNISEKGMGFLEGRKTVRVEFVGMATQVVFDTTIIARQKNSILVTVPNCLISIERRKNARFVATPDFTSFVKFSCWSASVNDLASPPIFSHFADQANWLYIADMSEGGFCATARFPAPLTSIRSGIVDDNAKLYLPMRPPIALPAEVRWVKKIKEAVSTESNNLEQRFYKFGVQFLSLPEDARVSIRQYMQQLTTASAI